MSNVKAHSGRRLEDITLKAVDDGELSINDVRISKERLLLQAKAAEEDGSIQLGLNLRRAAELTMLSEERVLEIYEALRPKRSSADDLKSIADELDAINAKECARFVREAMDVYVRRGQVL